MPVEGFSDGAPLLSLLDEMLSHYEGEGDEAIYVHCSDGGGRTGLIGACMLALLQGSRPYQPAKVLTLAEEALACRRVGATRTSSQLSKETIMTECQRRFVHAFCSALAQ